MIRECLPNDSENSARFTRSHCSALGCNNLYERSKVCKRWHKDHTWLPLSTEHPPIYRAGVIRRPSLLAPWSALVQVRTRANYLRFLCPLKAVWCSVMWLIHMIAGLESEWTKYGVIKISMCAPVTCQMCADVYQNFRLEVPLTCIGEWVRLPTFMKIFSFGFL